jgi:hypothetical protein
MITQFSSLKKKEEIKNKRIKQIQEFEANTSHDRLGVSAGRDDNKKKIKEFFTFSNITPKPRRFLEINPNSEEGENKDLNSQSEDFSLLGDLEENQFDVDLEKSLDEFISNQVQTELSTPRPADRRPTINLAGASLSSHKSGGSSQNPSSASVDSEFSIGSLMEFKDEIIKTFKKSVKDCESETSSTLTDNTEYYSVYENSDLRVRGIDVDNLVDHKGKKFGMHDLFKARF